MRDDLNQRLNLKGQVALTRKIKDAQARTDGLLTDVKATASRQLESANQSAKTAAGRTMAVLDAGNLLAILVVGFGVFAVRRDFVAWRRSEAAANEARRNSEKKMQQECRRLQELSTVGRLAGGVAHDFNNLLTIMMGCCEATLYGLRPDDPHRTPLGTALQAGQTAAGLSRQLVSLSRGRPARLALLDVSAAAAEMSSMLRRLVGDKVELELTLDQAAPLVMADRLRLEQVLLNLVANARDASADYGKVRIETRRAGNEVQLSVIDEGCGMDEATQARIFEPFFTTKEDGKGTGLGMAVASEAVRECGGRIEVESAVGRGTAIRVYLPAAEVGPSPATVLLVDPQGQAVDLIIETLKGFGHTVLTARGEAESLTVARTHQGPIHLLVVEAPLAGEADSGLAARLTSKRPEMKVLFLVDDAVAARVRFDPAAAVLPRPFSSEVVGRTLREVLSPH